jgi:methyl-accepting chemotaxis protein
MIIDRIHDFQASIASAVEQQSTTTREIARGVADVAGEAASMTSVMAAVGDAIEHSAQNLSKLRIASQRLSQLSHEMSTVSSHFRL